MEFKDDLYAMLNIPNYSSIKVVKQAYHVLAKKYHPDVSNHDGKLFSEITDAYKILSNSKSKIDYDNYLKTKEELENAKKYYAANNPNYDDTIKTDLDDEVKAAEQKFYKSAAKTMSEDEEDIVGANDTSSKYYVNPKNEPIFTVIRHFTHYRFENAIAAIWNRSIFVLFGAALLYTILTPISIFFKICDCSVNKHNYKYHWLATLNTSLQTPKIIKPITWTIILYIFTITKLFTNICNCLFWIFKNLIVPFLLPNAVRSLRK